MELLFLDESGDNGLAEGSSKFYILAGISFDDYRWKENFWKIVDYRRRIMQKYGILIDELRGSELFTHRGPFFNTPLTPGDLEQIYRQLIYLICDNFDCKIFVVIKSKEEFKSRNLQVKNLVKLFNQEIWIEYLTIYERYLIEKSMISKHPQTGLVYFDSIQEKFVRKMIRQFSRKFDQGSQFPAAGIIEDVIFRDSKTSHFVQMADIIAFSVNRVITGAGEHDVFSISPWIIEKLKSKIKGRM